MIWVNGEHENTIIIADRGLQYGDGVFETIAVMDGNPLLLGQHLDRLQSGCQALAISCPDRALLISEIASCCRHAAQHLNSSNAVIKVIVTRGQGGRGYRPPVQATPTRIVSLHPWPTTPKNYAVEGIAMRFCQTRLGINPSLAGIKHLNRLEQVLARAEWDDPDIQEGVMLDTNGQVIEGTMSNLFYVKANSLYTACLKQAGIAGIVRQQLINLAHIQGHSFTEQPVTQEMLLAADEIFVSNSIIGIWPVRQIGQHHFAIGPITRQLQAGLMQVMRGNRCAN